ncbi:MAG: F0F1 ATP synthase subunit A [Candidatus Gracilibacteria bacterium]
MTNNPFHRPELPSNIVFDFGFLHITNSVLASFTVTVLLVIVALIIRRNFAVIPSRIQIVLELLVNFFLGTLKDAYGSEERARKFLPLIMTYFLYLLMANLFFIIPLINSTFVNSDGHTFPLFRVSTSDWSQTLALGLITVVGAHIIALTIHPIKHIGAFIRVEGFWKARSFGDIMNAFINFFIGIMEIIGEFARPVSLSARLFGNIFAGEMMVAVIASIMAPFTWFILPMPFLALGIFVGLIQAFVFTFLSILFMAQTVQAAHHSSH